MSKDGFVWPNGNRIAVVISCLFENWSERNAPSYSPMTTPLKAGTYDRAGVTWSQYGGRNGVWRLLRILHQHRVKASFIANARSIELYPRAVAEIQRAGHEIAAHGYTQDSLLVNMTPEEERATIRRCVKVFEERVGSRPVGWLSPVLAATDHTADIIAEEGFLWYGDYNDIDLPCRVQTKSGAFAALPHTDFADNRVLRQSPRSWFDVHKDTFDYLYQNEPNAYLNITLHCNFGGRPLIAAMFDKILKYILGFPGVWIVRHDELARWIMDNRIEEWSYEDRFFG